MPIRRMQLGALAAVVVLALAILSGVFVSKEGMGERSRTLTAEFTTIDGIFPGSQVRILGVVVGSVESVSPEGARVRVGMRLDPGTQVPADVGVLVVNPSVIADRFLELTPAYEGGPEIAEGAVIGVEKTRVPLDFEQFLSSLNTLTEVFEPQAGATAETLAKASKSLDGRGPSLDRAIGDLASVSTVVGGRTSDIEQIISELSILVTAVGGRDRTLSDLVVSLDSLGSQLQEDQIDLGAAAEKMRTIFEDVDRIVQQRGADITAATADGQVSAEVFAKHRKDWAEFLDLYPLMMSNLARSTGPDGRARFRLDVSSDITQFAQGRQLCETYPLPLCTGAGLTNPLVFPVDKSDPLGLLGALRQATGAGK